MATYTPASRNVPSSQRVVKITAVAALDQIDLVAVLGRPARRVQITTTAPTDAVAYTLNSLIKVRTRQRDEETLTVAQRAYGAYGTSVTEVWGPGDSFSSIGETILTAEEVNISSIQIDSVTLGTGTTVTLVVW